MDRRRGEDAGSGVLECRLPFGNESRLKNPSPLCARRIFLPLPSPLPPPSLRPPHLFGCPCFDCRLSVPYLCIAASLCMAVSPCRRFCPAVAFVLSSRFSPSDKAPLIRSDPRPVPRPSTHSGLPRCRCENARSRHPEGCRLLAYDASPAAVRPDRYSTTSLPE